MDKSMMNMALEALDHMTLEEKKKAAKGVIKTLEDSITRKQEMIEKDRRYIIKLNQQINE